MPTGLSHDEFERLFQHWPDPLLGLDADGAPMAANQALLELFRDAGGDVPTGLTAIDPTALEALLRAAEWLSVRAADGGERHFRLLDIDLGGHRLRALRDVTREHEARSELERQQGASDAALKDPLTGLRNRRALSLALAPLVSLARRYQRPLSILALAVSDADGRALDDPGLLAASQALSDQTRWADIIALTGDRRFVVVLPETSAEAAARLAGKLRSLLAEAGLRLQAGAADCRKTDDADSLVQRALEDLDRTGTAR